MKHVDDGPSFGFYNYCSIYRLDSDMLHKFNLCSSNDYLELASFHLRSTNVREVKNAETSAAGVRAAVPTAEL